MSIRSKESPLLRGDASRPSTPTKSVGQSLMRDLITLFGDAKWLQAPPMSRASSANTVQGGGAGVPPGPRQPSVLPRRTSYQRSLKTEPMLQHHQPEGRAEDVDSSSASQSDNEATDQHRQAFKRPPPFLSARSRIGPYEDGEDDDDEDDSPAFLPVQEINAAAGPETDTSTTPAENRSIHSSPATTITTNERQQGQRPPSSPNTHSSSSRSVVPHTALASNNQVRPTQQSPPASNQQLQRRRPHPPQGPLSPRRTAELVGRPSPRRYASKPGSDGTPSMGSSFSDLDGPCVRLLFITGLPNETK